MKSTQPIESLGVAFAWFIILRPSHYLMATPSLHIILASAHIQV